MSWAVHRARGSAADFHQRDLPSERGLWLFEVERPTVVLGSRQVRVDVADGDVEVVRRRSGGGAVYLEPRRVLWVDVVLPRTDPLWDDDVGRAAHWLGAVWGAAVGGDAVVHRGPMVSTQWSDDICFAGLGPGEVTVAGRKVVGISQRRTRDAARFQCVAYERWDPHPLVDLLGVAADLATVGAGVGALSTVEAALIAQFS